MSGGKERMKAILLAAGLSSRLSGGVPKTLLPLYGQTTIIGHTILQLDKLGFSTMVVVGYRAPFFLSTLSTSVSFAYNPIYASTSTLYSLKIAVDLLKEEDPVLVAYADQLIGMKTLKKLIQVPDSVLVTPLTPEVEAEYALQVREGKIIKAIPFKKFPDWGKKFYGFGGFAFLSQSVLSRLENLDPDVLAHRDPPMIFEGCLSIVGKCENVNNPVGLIRVRQKLRGGVL